MSYNGWRNYETWATNLWIGDDEYLKEQIADLSDQDAADVLQEYVHEMRDQLNATGFLSDLLNGAISEIDFVEIAQSMKEE